MEIDLRRSTSTNGIVAPDKREKRQHLLRRISSRLRNSKITSPVVLHVRDNFFLASHPKNPSQIEDHVSLLLDNEVNVLVSAVEDIEQKLWNCSNYFSRVCKAGIRVVRCPVKDMSIPSVQDLISLSNIVKEHTSNGLRIAFQCGEGLGRAPAILSACLVIYGYTAKEAVTMIREVRPNSFLTFTQLRLPGRIENAIK